MLSSDKSLTKLSLSEIFTHGVAFIGKKKNYELNNVRLIENTPEEIHDIEIEMLKRLDCS